MGWTFQNRDKGLSTRDFFAEALGANLEIVASNVTSEAFYAAVKNTDTAEVFAFVALIKWSKGYFNFGYKDMDECMGPGSADASQKVLDALTETDHEYALEWRASCRKSLERQAIAKKVGSGTKVDFGREIEFADGGTGQVFELIERNTFRRADGRRVRITKWRKNYTWSVAA